MVEDQGSKIPGEVNLPIAAGVSRVSSGGGVSRPGILVGPIRKPRPVEPQSRWPQPVQYLVIVSVTLLFLLLVVSMQRHHFFNGEHEKFHSADR
jgi:hypothetical protein